MEDAALLAAFEWAPASLDDVDEMPERTLWLLVSYRTGVVDAARKGASDA